MSETVKKEGRTKQKSDNNWKIVHQLGRAQKPLAGPGSEASMLKEFERLVNVQMPGNVILLDGSGEIQRQTMAFADDKSRRGKDENGKPYEPEIKEVGPGRIDLRAIRDYVASLPETDPALDPPDYEPPPFEPKKYGTPEATKDPAPTPKTRAPKDMREVPCETGMLGFFGYVQEVSMRIAEMKHQHRRLRARKWRFVLGLAIRGLARAPLCTKTARAAYARASQLTRI